jgi:hypothetical protein
LTPPPFHVPWLTRSNRESSEQASAGGVSPADVDFLNGEIAGFLDLVTQKGKRLE